MGQENAVFRENVRFVDCTLRDGGYYNDWDFSHDLIERYVQAVASAGVNIAEMGFRFVKDRGFQGRLRLRHR